MKLNMNLAFYVGQKRGGLIDPKHLFSVSGSLTP